MNRKIKFRKKRTYNNELVYGISIDSDKYIEQLQEENKKLNGAIQTYNILLKSNVEENKILKERYSKLEEKYFANVPCCNENDCDLYRDYMKLKDNWNKLKEYVGIEWYSYDNDSIEFEVAKDILNKIQKLESENRNE